MSRDAGLEEPLAPQGPGYLVTHGEAVAGSEIKPGLSVVVEEQPQPDVVAMVLMRLLEELAQPVRILIACAIVDFHVISSGSRGGYGGKI